MKFDEFIWNAHLVIKDLPLDWAYGMILVAGFGYAVYRGMKEEI